jgi:Allene oxide cyclase
VSISLSFRGMTVAALILAGTHVASAQDTTIAVVERAATDKVIDVGDKGDSTGDILTFANELYDEGNANKIGEDSGWCIRIVAGKSWECAATFTLADGQLTAAGPFLDAGDSVWSVTGGTGKYASSRGEMQLHSRNPEGSEFDMKFQLH